MMSDFDQMAPEDYAALWGCDPVYDTAPRLPGDGYKFYNYSVDKDKPEFLREFIHVIERTIKAVKQNPENHEPTDESDLGKLLEHVKRELKDK